MIRNSEKEVAKRIKEKTAGQFVYISGYNVKESKVVVQCVECGELFERTYHHITTHGTECPACKKRERKRINAERLKAKEEARQKRIAERKKREAEAERKRAERNKPHRCPVCGELTTRRKYCSDRCRLKVNNTRKDIRRRNKIKTAMVDSDITVDALFKRDKGICHICGCLCDRSDYVTRGENFIAGDKYPSIDHVVPLIRGGLHAWNNVKLAHRLCNSKKGDKISNKYPSMFEF